MYDRLGHRNRFLETCIGIVEAPLTGPSSSAASTTSPAPSRRRSSPPCASGSKPRASFPGSPVAPSERMPTMMPSQPSFATQLAQVAEQVEAMLGALLSDETRPGEIARPGRLMAAMRHAVLGGGKRLRPFLVVEAARLCGRADEGTLRAGCAVELLHGYSLVHDDLPSMDDDDLRRGRPTVHRAFDEATAILAGDALQTLAFEVLADPATDPDGAIRSDLVLGLARAAGLGGMVGGQMLDLAAEGRYGDAHLDEGA